MCLNTKQLKPLKATKDITVYKTAYCYSTKKQTKAEFTIVKGKLLKGGGGEIVRLEATSKTGYRYKVGAVMTAILQPNCSGGSVNPGFHSYQNKVTCVKNESGSVVLTCVIPKGSLYYKGTNNGNGAGYCSNQLKIVEVNSKS